MKRKNMKQFMLSISIFLLSYLFLSCKVENTNTNTGEISSSITIDKESVDYKSNNTVKNGDIESEVNEIPSGSMKNEDILLQSKGGENELSIDNILGASEDTIILFDGNFERLINDNPIDHALQWEISDSAGRIQFANIYCEAWEQEIKHTIKELETYLSEEDYSLICAAYDGWELYMQDTTLLEQQLFYIGTNYRSAKDDMIIGDNETYPHVMEVAAIRTRNYAIELLSYLYALSGNIEFIYLEE